MYLPTHNILLEIYDTLHARYGDLHWWPAKTPYEVIVGAVLTQNTAWSNVEKAIANFGDELTPERVAAAGAEELTELIRPSGFFNQKADYLKAVTAWFEGYGYCVSNVQSEPADKLRRELLATKGVGQETADSILLYAFGLPVFVVDAYTYRLCDRYPLEVGGGYVRDKGNAAGGNYAAVKAFFENNLPKSAQLYNNYHALIVINGKDHCRKKPLCENCPLAI